MATEKYVKFLMVEFPALVPDPWNPSGDKVPAMRTARHGQKVTTEETPDAPEDRDQNTVYGLQDYDLKRLDEMGAFFTDVEHVMFTNGVTNDDRPQEGDVVGEGDRTATPAFGADGEPIAHPISLGEYTIEQLAELIKSDQIDADELVEAVVAEPTLRDLIVSAEELATEGQPREEVVQAIADALSEDRGSTEDVSRPALSSSRGEWNDYAMSLGIADASDLGSKEQVQEAVAALDA